MRSIATALKTTLISTAELHLIWFLLGVILGERGNADKASGVGVVENMSYMVNHKQTGSS